MAGLAEPGWERRARRQTTALTTLAIVAVWAATLAIAFTLLRAG